MPESISRLDPVAQLEDPPGGELVICHSCHVVISGTDIGPGPRFTPGNVPISFRICDGCKGFVVEMVTITVPRKDMELAISLLETWLEQHPNSHAEVVQDSPLLQGMKATAHRLLDALGRAT